MLQSEHIVTCFLNPSPILPSTRILVTTLSKLYLLCWTTSIIPKQVFHTSLMPTAHPWCHVAASNSRVNSFTSVEETSGGPSWVISDMSSARLGTGGFLNKGGHLLMAEILQQLTSWGNGSVFLPLFVGFQHHPRWLFGISAINSTETALVETVVFQYFLAKENLIVQWLTLMASDDIIYIYRIYQ